MSAPHSPILRPAQWALFVLVALLSAGCGGDDGASAPADDPDAVDTTPEVEPPPVVETTAVAEPQEPPPTVSDTVSRSAPFEIEVTRDVRYGEDREAGFHRPLVDVYAPTADGPWPLVVMFHGGGGQFQDKSGVADRARAVAERGAVVFTPNVGGPSADPNSRDFRILEDGGPACAASFAVARGAGYGADTGRLTVTGFSGGANASVMVTVSDDPPSAEFCAVEVGPIEPDSLVLWEGDFLLAPWWDDTLEANPEWYGERWLWSLISPDLPGEWHLMTGELDRDSVQRLAVEDPFGTGDECGRPVAAGEAVPALGGMCRFWELRDPAGDLRRDADSMELFDDGWFTIGEMSILLANRLEAAGIEPTMTLVEGATHGDLTPEGLAAYAALVVPDR